MAIRVLVKCYQVGYEQVNEQTMQNKLLETLELT